MSFSTACAATPMSWFLAISRQRWTIRAMLMSSSLRTAKAAKPIKDTGGSRPPGQLEQPRDQLVKAPLVLRRRRPLDPWREPPGLGQRDDSSEPDQPGAAVPGH